MALLDEVPNPTDPTFLSIRDVPQWSAQRERLSGLWERYKPYADAQFLVEIGRDFHARYWEMSLACELVDQGLSLVPMHDRIAEGPDICVSNGETTIWLEAVAPSSGTGDDAVDYSEEEGGFIPRQSIVLRYQSAIFDKHVKLQKYQRNGIVNEGEPFAIAVYGWKIPAAGWGDNVPYAAQAVFPVGPRMVTIDVATRKVVHQRYAYRPAIGKKSGSEVPTTAFLDPQFASISAIVSGNPHPIEMWSRRLTIIHNPIARNPLPRGWLKRGVEYWVEENRLRHRLLCDSV